MDQVGVMISADGVWINQRTLWAVATGIAAQAKRAVTADQISRDLFFEACRPNVAAVLDAVAQTYDPSDDKWWTRMIQHDHYNRDLHTVEPVPSGV